MELSKYMVWGNGNTKEEVQVIPQEMQERVFDGLFKQFKEYQRVQGLLKDVIFLE